MMTTMTPLAELPDPSADALWSALCALIERLGRAVEQRTVLDECLDLLIELLGADRGLILLGGPGEAPLPVNARGHKRALREHERTELSRTVIDAAQRAGRATIYRPLEEEAAAASVAQLGIVTALAGPLQPFAGDGAARPEPIGALYLDFRRIDRRIGERHRAFFDVAAHLIAAALVQARRLGRAEAELHAAQSVAFEGPLPSLESLLRSPHLDRVRREVATAIATDSPMLVTGETGTGKTLLAHVIAEASGRRPVVRATLGSSDDLNTITSELFGHERGAFSGAAGARTGVVAHADGGTLILDEILNLPPAAQQLLLDFTQFGTYRPLGYGGAQPRRARVRIIAATQGDLADAMRTGRFRRDLYYRLAGVTLHLPPLRERRSDIPALAETHLRRGDPERAWTLALPARRLLMSPAVEWPGNIRQLEAIVTRARFRALAEDPDATRLDVRHFDAIDLGVDDLAVPAPAAVPDPGAPVLSTFQIELDELADTWRRLEIEQEALGGLERRVIAAALDAHDGVVAHAARALGVPRTTLSSRISRLGLDR